MRTRQLGTVVLLAAAAVLIPAGAAQAACHRFDVSAAPAQVNEGAVVTVTVTRDAGVADSQVDVKSVHGTTEPGDFPPVSRTVSFQGGGTQQQFEIVITNDAEMEQAESFKLRLSNPGGCEPNPNFSLGPDATVTIKASDQVIVVPSPTPTKSKPGSIAPAPTKSATPSAAATSASPSPTRASPTASPSPTDTSSPSEPNTSPLDIASDDSDGGTGLGAIAAVVGVLALGLGTGAVVYLRRNPRT